MASTVRHGELHLAKHAVTIGASQGNLPRGVSVIIGSEGLPDVDLDAADTNLSYGILTSAVDEGDSGSVVSLGDVLARSGDTYALGAHLTTNSSGEFITATSGDRIKALALEASAAADTLYLVRIIPAGPIVPA
jgi:hypothetical protein